VRVAAGVVGAAVACAIAGCSTPDKLETVRRPGSAVVDAGGDGAAARTDAGALPWELVGVLEVGAYNGLVASTAVVGDAFYGVEIGGGWEFARYEAATGARTVLAVKGAADGLHGDGAACAVGSRVYFLGGGGNGVFSMWLDQHWEVVDLAAQTWLPGGFHAAAYHAPGVAAGEGRCVMLGGNAGGGLTPTVGVQELAIATGTWENLPPVPRAVVRPGGVIVGGVVVAAGGARDLEPGDSTSTYNGVAIADVAVLTAGAAAWSPGPSLPRPLYAPELVAARGRVFLFGGVDNGDPVPRPEVLSWAVGDDAWRVEGAIPPDAAVGAHGFAIGDDLYVVVFANGEQTYENRLYRWRG
jgi:hypothetical protein